MMTESLLHFIWKYKLFDTGSLLTSDGEPVSILNSGVHNYDAGPDFSDARVKIGDTLWAGHVEMHVKGSDWVVHGHHEDKAYDNVVLHVVYDPTKERIQNSKGENIPTLELSKYIAAGILERYRVLMQSKTWIACENFFRELDPLVIGGFRERLLIERLENKNNHIGQLLEHTKNDWEQVTYQLAARYFGSSVNREAFEAMAQSLPISVVSKYGGDPLKIEALLFGQAGLLDKDYQDAFPRRLKTEYNYLKRLHQLRPLSSSRLKFLRLRPANFPTLRLAQLAAMIGKEPKLFSSILAAHSIAELHALFDVKVDSYWHSHYVFDKESEKVKWHIGKDMKNTLVINVIAPLLFCYGKYKGEEEYCERAMAYLEATEAEKNNIVNGWENRGLRCRNAAETQAMIQLKKEYCEKYKCLHCAAGIRIIKQK